MASTPVIAGLAGFVIIGILILIGLFISAAILLWGARIAGIKNRTFGRAIATIILGGIASTLLSALLSMATPLGIGLGAILGFCVSAVIMMAIFNTTFGKALAANIITWVLSIVVGIGLAMVFAVWAAFLAAGA